MKHVPPQYGKKLYVCDVKHTTRQDGQMDFDTWFIMKNIEHTTCLYGYFLVHACIYQFDKFILEQSVA